MKVPKVSFEIASLETEARRIFNSKDRLTKDSELRSQSIFNIPFSEDIRNKIVRAKTFDEIRSELVNYLSKFKPKKSISLSKIEKEWSAFGKPFFEELKKLTNKECSFKEYECKIIFSSVGHYLEGTNKIFTTQYDSIRKVIEVCGEEILHLHYWEIVRKLFNIEVNSFIRENAMMPWKISEVVPDYMLVENDALTNKGYYRNWNRSDGYPWIPELRKVIDPLWHGRKNFEDFLVKAHKAIGVNVSFSKK